MVYKNEEIVTLINQSLNCSSIFQYVLLQGCVLDFYVCFFL